MKMKFKYLFKLLIMLLITSCNQNQKVIDNNINFNDNVVLYINNIAVSKDEFKLFMQENKSRIISIYSQLYHKDPNATDFWDKKINESISSPLDSLKSLTLKNLIKTKTEEFCFLSEGLIRKIPTYNELVLELDSINSDRKQRKLNNEIIYGPIEYDMNTYLKLKYYKLQANLRNFLGKKFNIKDHYQLNEKYEAVLEQYVLQSKTKINKELYNKLKLE
jgi:hypothetical protein